MAATWDVRRKAPLTEVLGYYIWRSNYQKTILMLLPSQDRRELGLLQVRMYAVSLGPFYNPRIKAYRYWTFAWIKSWLGRKSESLSKA